MTDLKQKTHALVLSGGGANGAYEIGVIKALLGGQSPSTDYQPADLKIVTGTSIGAFNAAVLLSNWQNGGVAAADYLEHVWRSLVPQDDSTPHNHIFRYRADPFDLLDPAYNLRRPGVPSAEFASDLFFFAQDWFRRGINFFESRGNVEHRTLRLFDLSTLISNQPTARLLKETVHFDELRTTERRLRITATNWRTGLATTFENHEMTDAAGPQIIMGSAAIPGLFRQVEVNGEYYADGGVVMNTPLAPAIHEGAEVLHVLYLNPEVKDIPLLRVANMIDTISRMFAIQFAATMNRDIEVARNINHGITVLRESSHRLRSEVEARSAVEAAGKLPMPRGRREYRELTIHRYQPRDTLGGILSLLRFDRDRINELIEQGMTDAVHHNCLEEHCVIPEAEFAERMRKARQNQYAN